MILFLLKAYKPYIPWMKERFHCFILDDHVEQPHRMMRTSSKGDRTEMLMLTDDSAGSQREERREERMGC